MASARTSGAGDEPSTWPELLFAWSASRVNAMTRIWAAATSCAITKLGADAGACLAAPRAMAISPSRPGMSGAWHIPALAGTEREYLLWVDVTPFAALGRTAAIARTKRLAPPCSVIQTATATAASIGAFWPGKVHAKRVADGRLAPSGDAIALRWNQVALAVAHKTGERIGLDTSTCLAENAPFAPDRQHTGDRKPQPFSQADELKGTLALKPFRLQFISSAPGRGPSIVTEVGIQASDAWGAIVAAAKVPLPPRTIELRIPDSEGREVFNIHLAY